jgi:hypothetical protein
MCCTNTYGYARLTRKGWHTRRCVPGPRRVPKRLFLDDASLAFSVPWMVLMWSDPGPHIQAVDNHNRHSQKVGFHPGTPMFRLPSPKMDRIVNAQGWMGG